MISACYDGSTFVRLELSIESMPLSFGCRDLSFFVDRGSYAPRSTKCCGIAASLPPMGCGKPIVSAATLSCAALTSSIRLRIGDFLPTPSSDELRIVCAFSMI